ncbi:hypothetical protein FHS36_002146 [Streptomyces eurocidicus]|uniref:Uncharacterized protein n=1 Tax=Streptomyces eurocidicus TaxID=66423 RepID=A0A7W8F0J6_STREU|nr:hypothetical protein [Streptomyces eurocidicus]
MTTADLPGLAILTARLWSAALIGLWALTRRTTRALRRRP